VYDTHSPSPFHRTLSCPINPCLQAPTQDQAADKKLVKDAKEVLALSEAQPLRWTPPEGVDVVLLSQLLLRKDLSESCSLHTVPSSQLVCMRSGMCRGLVSAEHTQHHCMFTAEVYVRWHGTHMTGRCKHSPLLHSPHTRTV
jgi:hypothetical protein